MDPADDALSLTSRILAAIPEDTDPQVAALALIGAGIMLLAETDPATTHGLVDALANGALRDRPAT